MSGEKSAWCRSHDVYRLLPAVSSLTATTWASGRASPRTRRRALLRCSARLGTGVRLHVGVLRTEQPFGSLDGEALHDVHVFAAAVVAAAGLAPRRTCWSGLSLAPEARREERSSPRRSVRGCHAAVRAPVRPHPRCRNPPREGQRPWWKRSSRVDVTAHRGEGLHLPLRE